MAGSPTLRRRRLAAELRQQREAKGWTIDVAAAKADISPSHLSRTENAAVGVSVRVVKDLVAAYETPTELADYLVQIAKEANQRGWWHSYSEAIPAQYATYIGFESEASKVMNYEGSVMPGLLQTEDYALAMFKGGSFRFTKDEIARRVEVRMARQQVFQRPDMPTFWFLLDEAALRRQVGGPKVMRNQLLHVAEVATLPHVDIQVLPFAIGAHPGTPGSVAILEFAQPSDPPVVYLETLIGDIYPEKKSEVDSATMSFNRLQAMALSPEDSLRFIQRVAEESK